MSFRAMLQVQTQLWGRHGIKGRDKRDLFSKIEKDEDRFGYPRTWELLGGMVEVIKLDKAYSES